MDLDILIGAPIPDTLKKTAFIGGIQLAMPDYVGTSEHVYPDIAVDDTLDIVTLSMVTAYGRIARLGSRRFLIPNFFNKLPVIEPNYPHPMMGKVLKEHVRTIKGNRLTMPPPVS